MRRKIPFLFYGLLAGIILTIYIQVLDLSRLIYETSWGVYLGYLAILILPVCIFLALREIKRKNLSLPFSQALLSGLLVSCITATVYCAYIFIDTRFFGASHLDNLFEYTSSSMKKAGHSAAEINERIKGMKLHYHSARPYISTYVSYLVLGTLFSVLFFFLLRKSNKNQSI